VPVGEAWQRARVLTGRVETGPASARSTASPADWVAPGVSTAAPALLAAVRRRSRRTPCPQAFPPQSGRSTLRTKNELLFLAGPPFEVRREMLGRSRSPGRAWTPVRATAKTRGTQGIRRRLPLEAPEALRAGRRRTVCEYAYRWGAAIGGNRLRDPSGRYADDRRGSTGAENAALAAKALKTSHARLKVQRSIELMAAAPAARVKLHGREIASLGVGGSTMLDVSRWSAQDHRRCARASQRVHDHAASEAGHALHA
jgi:hypothetical protein